MGLQSLAFEDASAELRLGNNNMLGPDADVGKAACTAELWQFTRRERVELTVP
jgi:hypothetical protein